MGVQTLYKDIPVLLPCMGLEGEPLPLLWTADYIPKNPEGWDKKENAGPYETAYVVGEFNCSCVGISKFQAVCGGEKSLADVPDEDRIACRLAAPPETCRMSPRTNRHQPSELA